MTSNVSSRMLLLNIVVKQIVMLVDVNIFQALHRHFTEHAANEQSIMTKS